MTEGIQIWAAGKHGNVGTEMGTGTGMETTDVENVSQSRGHTLAKSLR